MPRQPRAPFAPRRSASLIAASILFLLATGCAGAKPLCDDIRITDPRRADLTCIGRWIDLEKSWPAGAQSEARAKLEALESVAESLSDVDFYVRVAAIVALPRNGHTSLARAPIYRQFGLLPIRAYWFDDGLFVVRAAPDRKQLLGARILAIAGQTPDALMSRLKSYYGGTDEDFRTYGLTAWFLSPAVLHAAGLSPSPDAITIRLEMANGSVEAVDLKQYPTSGEHPVARAWRQLHPQALEGETAPWATWLGKVHALPWAFGEVDEAFRYRFLPAQRVAHVQFRINTDGQSKIQAFLKHLERKLSADRPQHIIWDQRQNSGGDLTRTADFSRELHAHLPEDGRVYVLTSHATFSAGIYTAFFPEAANDDRTRVVGTRVGDSEQFWAESAEPVVLPETGWRIYYSLQKHDLAKGCHDETCHIKRDRWQISVGSFEPEIPVPERSTDLLEGRDAGVEWVLADLRSGDSSP